jgi:hypothetical protein
MSAWREAEGSGAERPSWRLDRFRGWRAVAEAAVWAQSVVILAPPARDVADLVQAVEDLAIEQFIAKAGVDPEAGEANLSINPFSQGLPRSM